MNSHTKESRDVFRYLSITNSIIYISQTHLSSGNSFTNFIMQCAVYAHCHVITISQILYHLNISKPISNSTMQCAVYGHCRIKTMTHILYHLNFTKPITNSIMQRAVSGHCCVITMSHSLSSKCHEPLHELHHCRVITLSHILYPLNVMNPITNSIMQRAVYGYCRVFTNGFSRSHRLRWQVCVCDKSVCMRHDSQMLLSKCHEL